MSPFGQSTTMVIRETPESSVRPTASDSMLKLRRRNRDATRFSTPGLFSTNAMKVWFIVSPHVPALQVSVSSDPALRPEEPSDIPLPPAPHGTRAQLGPSYCAPIQWPHVLLHVL